MSNTVITNYTDLNGPSTKADSAVVVIVNKDGSLSVDQKLLGTLMGTDGSQSAGISVVRVGHEGRPDDATDSENEDDKIAHVTLSVDSYYNEPNSIIKYDSGAEMLQSLRIETRENSLVGFQNDHCYTSLTSPSQTMPQSSENYITYDEPVIEITHKPPPKPVPNSKRITILDQQIIPKGKKLVISSTDSPLIIKSKDTLNKPLMMLTKPKDTSDADKNMDIMLKGEDSVESSSISSSGDSIPDRDSDSDYKDSKDRTGSLRLRRNKLKPRILKNIQGTKVTKLEPKVVSKLKTVKNIVRRENKEKLHLQKIPTETNDPELDLESILPKTEICVGAGSTVNNDISKVVLKQTPKQTKKEKKTPSHVTALLSDMSSLFSTPDVIRRVSTENKMPPKIEKEPIVGDKRQISTNKPQVELDTKYLMKVVDSTKSFENMDKTKVVSPKSFIKQKDKVEKTVNVTEKPTKGYDIIPQLDDDSLAQIFQDTTGISNSVKNQSNIPTSSVINSPGLAGPLSPTLDLLGGLQPEEEGLSEDLLMHVAQLVESSENLQEVIDKQVLGKVDTGPPKTPVHSPFQQAPQTSNLYAQALTKSAQKVIPPRKDPIEIVRRDGRVITLPPIEAPATRSSKRKVQMDTSITAEQSPTAISSPVHTVSTTPEPQIMVVSKQYVNKKLTNKKLETVTQASLTDKSSSAESQESWNSEDDPNRLWCICKQPHNNRFMICCDGCEDWFHGKCVNITKAMGQQMEEQGIEWRCPNCIKKAKPGNKLNKMAITQKKIELDILGEPQTPPSPAAKDVLSKTTCIVCKKIARASSIYCSDTCILKHAQDSLSNQTKESGDPGKSQEKQKLDSRVIVYERKTGRLLAGPNAPTAENLKAWLQQNPTFEVVRPGTLSTTKPGAAKKKASTETNKVQTTLNFERLTKKTFDSAKNLTPEVKERVIKPLPSPKEEAKIPALPKTPVTTKMNQVQLIDIPKASTSSAKVATEPRKPARSTSNRSQSTNDKAPSGSPSTPRRKTEQRARMNSTDPIRDNVRKSLQEQLQIRMMENKDSKFSKDEIQQFATDTELELHELFRDVGIKYKAKYRSLMFNIKDRKNLSLWQKICNRSITPKQLVRLSPEELASQELAQWRDKEAKHQLELIKKSELDLLAASKTYVLKTHKGEEVMETKESVSTELDPNVPVEDLVTVLNDSIVGEEDPKEQLDKSNKYDNTKKQSSRKRERDDSRSRRSKKSRKESKRELEWKKSRSSRSKYDSKEKELRENERRPTRRSDKKSTRERSVSKERSKESTEKLDSSQQDSYRPRSRDKIRRRPRSREYSRSTSQGRERSRSRDHSRRRSQSRDSDKRRSSRSKHTSSTDDKKRSRSQDNNYNKTKTDSTDSDSVERPKSAMLKEVHPEYDPHEPMITSAFSEEDLQKSRDDVFTDDYKNDLMDKPAEYDPAQSFLINSNISLPGITTAKKDKSETESDQEPSSTVDNSAAIVWNGCINMVDVARFYVSAHEVSGSAVDVEEDLNTELDIVGRINPDTVWEYIGKMKKANNKDIIVMRLQAANDEEKMQYIALYSYLSSRNRLGVVKVSNTTTVKDFYIVPLPANTTLPPVLLPFDGPGIGDAKTHLLIAIVIRQRKKRLAPHISKVIIPSKVARPSRKQSYTPPMLSKSSHTPPLSPKRRAQLPLPYTASTMSSIKNKRSCDDDEAYSPGSSTSSGSLSGMPKLPIHTDSTVLRTKVEELNRQIEEQKQQILKMAQADSSVGEEDEAYSPSRPMTPPTVVNPTLADISLPSNLHEILATIKQRTETNANSDIDMRIMPLP